MFKDTVAPEAHKFNLFTEPSIKNHKFASRRFMICTTPSILRPLMRIKLRIPQEDQERRDPSPRTDRHAIGNTYTE